MAKRTYIWLGRAELKLYQPYFCFLHSGRPTTALNHRLIEHKAINHFTVFYRPAYLFDDSHISQINIICGFLVDGFQHGVNSNRT